MRIKTRLKRLERLPEQKIVPVSREVTVCELDYTNWREPTDAELLELRDRLAIPPAVMADLFPQFSAGS